MLMFVMRAFARNASEQLDSIYAEQIEWIRRSRVIAMDETPTARATKRAAAIHLDALAV